MLRPRCIDGCLSGRQEDFHLCPRVHVTEALPKNPTPDCKDLKTQTCLDDFAGLGLRVVDLLLLLSTQTVSPDS